MDCNLDSPITLGSAAASLIEYPSSELSCFSSGSPVYALLLPCPQYRNSAPHIRRTRPLMSQQEWKRYGPLCSKTRELWDGDENRHIAKQIQRKNGWNRMRYIISNCLKLAFKDPRVTMPARLAAPEPRRFRWLISSHHVGPKYLTESLLRSSPWYMLLRCLLIDLPEQPENGINRELESWLHHGVDNPGETKFLTPIGSS